MIDWTAEKIAQLTAEWLAGTPTVEIGLRMNLSKNAVVGKAHRLNLPPRPSPIRHGGVPRPAQPRRVAASTATLPPLACVPNAVAIVAPKPPRPVKRAGTCCWPIGEPRAPGFRFCEAPCAGSYCAEHSAIAFVKRPDHREQAWPR